MAGVADIAGVILAGGKSSRFGSNKALATISGRPMVAIIAQVMAELFGELRLITNEPDSYSFLNWPMSQDIVRDAGPLAGIQAALTACQASEIFLVGCDMPFIRPDLIYSLCQGDNDAIVVPRLRQGMEPLFARYHRNVLSALTASLAQGERKLHHFIRQQQPRFVEEEALRAIDPQLSSFKNINHLVDMPAEESS